jgi:hypothetical protein
MNPEYMANIAVHLAAMECVVTSIRDGEEIHVTTIGGEHLHQDPFDSVSLLLYSTMCEMLEYIFDDIHQESFQVLKTMLVKDTIKHSIVQWIDILSYGGDDGVTITSLIDDHPELHLANCAKLQDYLVLLDQA